MSNLGDVEAAVAAVESTGNRQIILLHCVSNYPAAAADVNLRAMLSMRAAFGLPVGYSDHTLGIEVSLASVALGACVVEKHFTLDRNLPGPDHRASAEPDELRRLITGIRTVEAALGTGRKAPVAAELDTAKAARRSLVAAADLPAGTVLTDELIAIRRPGTGLPPAMKPWLISRTLRVSLAAGALLRLEDVGRLTVSIAKLRPFLIAEDWRPVALLKPPRSTASGLSPADQTMAPVATRAMNRLPSHRPVRRWPRQAGRWPMRHPGGRCWATTAPRAAMKERRANLQECRFIFSPRLSKTF